MIKYTLKKTPEMWEPRPPTQRISEFFFMRNFCPGTLLQKMHYLYKSDELFFCFEFFSEKYIFAFFAPPYRPLKYFSIFFISSHSPNRHAQFALKHVPILALVVELSCIKDFQVEPKKKKRMIPWYYYRSFRLSSTRPNKLTQQN